MFLCTQNRNSKLYFCAHKNVIAYPDEVGRGRNFLEAEATPERGEEVQEQEEDLRGDSSPTLYMNIRIVYLHNCINSEYIIIRI